MLLSRGEEMGFGAVYPELAGARVMITGVTSRFGVDISRAFADHRARLLLQIEEPSIEMDEVATMLAQSACDVNLYEDGDFSADDAIAFAQGPGMQAYGGLDVVINLVDLTPEDLVTSATLEDIENMISRKLLAPMLMSRVAANRMSLTMTDGLVLNVIGAPPIASARDGALASMVRATLATITRDEAAFWAQKGVRINAVAPAGASLALAGGRNPQLDHSTEPEIAALALYLASQSSSELSGQVFDASNIAKAFEQDQQTTPFEFSRAG